MKSERLREVFKKIEIQSNLIQDSDKKINLADSSKENQDKIGELIKSYLKFADIIDEAQLTIKKERTA